MGIIDPKIEVYTNGQDNDDDDNGEEDEIAPNQMRVAEIKAELDLRDIRYDDCFDKESLARRLQDARATGKANPQILERFNKQKLEETFKQEKQQELSDDDIQAAAANDGKLPGGMTPEQFKKLTSNPEIMGLLQSTKMQEAMRLMMSGQRDELERKLKEDPSLQETIQKLNSILRAVQ
jgi:hypothetical protein